MAAWPQSAEELIAVQLELAARTPAPWRPTRRPIAIGACVVVFERGKVGPGARGDRGWAAAAVLRGDAVEARATVPCLAGAPYAPGLLALREGPCLEAAVAALPVRPEVLLVDGTGRDHPRRAGLAVHLGAVLDLPTVGITHRPLHAAGAWPRSPTPTELLLDGEQVGWWLCTRPGTRPLAVHPGWRTGLATALAVALAASGSHRTPEVFREARRLARTARAGASRRA
jgi:deoxyribonuclease V